MALHETGGDIIMATVIVRYKVRSDKAEENVTYIEAIFEALQRNAPDGIRYLSMLAEDGVSFTHIASVETADGSNPLPELPEFQAFVADIADRCEVPPTPVSQTVVGTYRAFG